MCCASWWRRRSAGAPISKSALGGGKCRFGDRCSGDGEKPTQQERQALLGRSTVWFNRPGRAMLGTVAMTDSNHIPREKFVIGEGHYANWLPLTTRTTSDWFEIVPAPTPSGALWTLGIVIACLGFGMALFLKDKTSTAVVVGIVLFGVATAIGTVIAIAALFRGQQKRGDVLRVNQRTGEVHLPSHGLRFDPSCNVCVTVVTSPFYSETGGGGDSVSELQLVDLHESQTRRFVLARSDSRQGLEPIVLELHKHTKLQIREISHEGVFRPQVVEKTYDPAKKHRSA